MKPNVREAVLGIALAASLAGNAVSFGSRKPAHSEAKSVAPSRACEPVLDTDASAAAAACAEELGRCRDRGWELARRAMATPPPPVHAEAAPVARGDVSSIDQRDALCARGVQALRETWGRDRDLIHQGLRESLANKGEQDRNTAKVGGEIGDALNLSGRDRDALARDYQTMRQARIDAANTALHASPVDGDAMIAATRGLFADEDALAARYGGDAGRLAWRRGQVDTRTMLLALIATTSDHQPDEAIGW